MPVEDEIKQIISSSKPNKLSINLAKCKELVFWRPGLKSEFMPSLLPDVVRVTVLAVNYWVYLLISKVMYALPAWGGYVSRENISRIDKMLQKARRYSFTSMLHCFEELLEQADDKLFSGSMFPLFASLITAR